MSDFNGKQFYDLLARKKRKEKGIMLFCRIEPEAFFTNNGPYYLFVSIKY